MPQVVVLYSITSSNAKAMAEAIVEGVKSRNVDAKAVNFQEARIEDMKAADAIAIGSPTFYPIGKIFESLAKSNATDKIGAAFGSYEQSGETPVTIADKMRKIGMNVVDPILHIPYAPTEKDIEECKNLGEAIANRLNKTSRLCVKPEKC